MADPLWLADVLRAEGCKVVEMPGWKNRGHGDFGHVWGAMVHHTGSKQIGAEFIKRGRADLPGPIANVHVASDGTMNIVAVGVAWHAGTGSWKDIPRNSGNWHVIGFEVDYDGTTYTQAQWDGMVRACAAISRKLGKDAASSVVAHKEYAAVQGKWDPGNWDMNKFRAEVDARLRAPETPPAAVAREARVDLNQVVGSAVAGSDFKAELWRFILFADKNSWETLQAVRALEKRLERIEKKLEEK